MRRYDDIIRDFLISEGYTNVFRGTEKPTSTYIPDDSIFVAVRGGQAPTSQFSDTEQLHNITVQVMVRSKPGEEDEVTDLANDLYDTLRNADPTGTLVIRPLAAPIRLSIDGSDRYKFSLNLSVIAEE